MILERITVKRSKLQAQMTGKIRFTGLSVLFFLAGMGNLAAQNGWDDIRNNDDKTARSHFEEKLKADSTDRAALEGMIYLSELEGDDLSYKKYIRSLVNSHWEESDYFLYQNDYSISDPKILLSKTAFSEKGKIGARLYQAYQLEEKDQKDQAYKEFRKLTGDYQWSVIGPFKNISGSGYAAEYPVEKSPNQDTAYLDETGMKLKWVQCKYRNPDGSLYFDYYLPSTNSGVYYANTFINMPHNQTVQIRISRTSPLKLWLDDNLIFANDKDISFGYDNEWVQLNIPAGTHRLLLKYAVNSEYSAFNLFSSQNYDRHTALAADVDDDASYASDYSDYDYSDLFSGSGSQSGGGNLTLRITDTSGNLIQDITSSFKGNYKPSSYQTKITDEQLIRYYKSRIEKNPNDLYGYYALCMAYSNAGLSEDGEEFFVKAYRKNKDIVFFKYLAAKMYNENGKTERFYEVLNNIDADKTPIFMMLYQKLNEKDKHNDEDEWLAALQKLYAVSPSNYSVIRDYVRYYDDKGMTKEKEDFIKQTSEKYPVYKDRLKRYLDKKDGDGDNDDDDDEPSNFSRAMNMLLSGDGGGNSYYKLNRYKRRGRVHKALKLYDKLIADEPYNTAMMKGKADFLLDKKKYDQALQELRTALEINPYSQDIYELMGDVYKEKEMKDSAVFYYKKAKYFARNNSYSFSSIDKKIEKVEDQKSQKKLFNTKKFEDILNDDAWKQRYSDEESVVLMYTRDLVLDEFNHAQLFQKFMVKILTDAGVNKWTEYNFNFLGNINSAKVIKTDNSEVVPDMQGGYAVFKDLKPGDVIEIEGTYSWQPSGELDNELALVTYLSFDAPIYYAKYEVAVPHDKYLGYRLHKLEDSTKKETREGYDFYRWQYSNLHKLEKEDATLDDYDMYNTIMISTMPDWSKVVSWYDRKTYQKLDNSYEIQEVLDSIIKPGMSQEAKVEAIYNYLTKDIKYSFVSFLQSGYIPKRCGLTLSSHIGDCKDVATLMVAMLRQVGVESYYTLVKTNFFDHQKYLPSQYFDHVIACYYLNGQQKFLDMTTDFYPHNVLTEADANAYALLIKPGVKDLIQLPQDNLDPKKNMVSMNIDATLSANRSVDVSVKAEQPGIAGGNIRERFSRYSQSEKKNLILDEMGKGVFPNVELKSYHFDNLKDITDTLSSSYELSGSGFSDKVANLLIFRVPYMTSVQSSQAILSKTRYNRLNLDAIGEVAPTLQEVDIHFPAGYQLIEVPADFSLSSKYGEYRVKYRKTKDGIHIEKYQSFKVAEVPVDEFDSFKAYYFQIMDADATRMAIQKKGPSTAAAADRTARN
jgi:hypothetical protein